MGVVGRQRRIWPDCRDDLEMEAPTYASFAPGLEKENGNRFGPCTSSKRTFEEPKIRESRVACLGVGGLGIQVESPNP